MNGKRDCPWTNVIREEYPTSYTSLLIESKNHICQIKDLLPFNFGWLSDTWTTVFDRDLQLAEIRQEELLVCVHSRRRAFGSTGCGSIGGLPYLWAIHNCLAYILVLKFNGPWEKEREDAGSLGSFNSKHVFCPRNTTIWIERYIIHIYRS